MKKQDKVTKENTEKYRKITQEALAMAKKNIKKGKENEEKAKEILQMVECYLSDSEHFEKQNHLVNALSCLNYAHGWLDAGVRLGIFSVKDSRLFAA